MRTITQRLLNHFFVDNIAITKERDMAYAKKDEDIQFEYIEQIIVVIY